MLEQEKMDTKQQSQGTPKVTTPKVATPGSQQKGPFFFSEASAPVPAKLVKKIQALEFVDMADLLPDNIEMRRQEEGTACGVTAHMGAMLNSPQTLQL